MRAVASNLQVPSSQQTAVPLSPLQQGMVFHRMAAPNSGIDIQQIVCAFAEDLDQGVLEASWQRIIHHHDVLRTALERTADGQMLQRPLPAAAVAFDRHDWSAVAADVRKDHFEAFLAADRRRGFDPEQPPFFRLTLIKLGEADYRLVWTFWHLLADGRSFPIVLRDALGTYDALRAGREETLAPVRPYRDFIQWLSRQNQADAEAFWCDLLEGWNSQTELDLSTPQAGSKDDARDELRQQLAPQVASALRQLATRHEVTLNTILQAAWAIVLSRYSGHDDVVFGATRACRRTACDGDGSVDAMVGLFMNVLPVRVRIDFDAQIADWLAQLRKQHQAVRSFEHTPLVTLKRWCGIPADRPLFESLVVFDYRPLDYALDWGPTRRVELHERTSYPVTLYAYADPDLVIKLAVDRARIDAEQAARMLDHLTMVLRALGENPDGRVRDLLVLPAVERQQVLIDWNRTSRSTPAGETVHSLFEQQASRTPEAVATSFAGADLTYAQLNARAEAIAAKLRQLGAGSDSIVGVCMARSADLPAALLGILKAGSAYLPIDPAYPAERIAFMLADAKPIVVLVDGQTLERGLAGATVPFVRVDDLTDPLAAPAAPHLPTTPRHLAYVIYTSGSTGMPKGVMVEHGNVVNFFAAMDDVLGTDPGVWLAVTSVSFDIAVLELLWTLSRGYRVVIASDSDVGKLPATTDLGSSGLARAMDFSLFYFAGTDRDGADKYSLLVEGAKFADRHAFAAVWTPERHFHAFGGLFPNPSVTSAALATITERVQLRAGSVVLPLHHPARVAEEWALVDNLSKGRVGVSFASGWHVNDFALAPDAYQDRRERMRSGIDIVQRLWRGESVTFNDGTGRPASLRLFPKPVQRELPIWLTAAGAPDTFRLAGELGANILTHLLGQNLEDLERKIAVYRKAWREHGHSGDGHVTLMLHTFVGDDLEEVRETVRGPFMEYLKTSSDLVKRLADGLKPGEPQPSAAEMEVLWGRAFDRYFETSGLFGPPERCLQFVRRLKGIGINEIACLIDFGVDDRVVLESLARLAEVKERSQQIDGAAADRTLAGLIRSSGVTHLQCTPSLLKVLLMTPGAREALSSLKVLLLGGEALSWSLVQELGLPETRILNMYGPTETSIWSTVAEVGGTPRTSEIVPVGRPIANTQVYIVDRWRRPVPIGVRGELVIGGAGVARGYLNRPELTAEKFIPNPFDAVGSLLYRTGDIVRYRSDGTIEFLGRVDQQVKIRGHRVEPGEIEAALRLHPAVGDAVVEARRQASGEPRLVAYLVAAGNGHESAPSPSALREFLRSKLPEALVPSAFVMLPALPRTPNGKLDRRALPEPGDLTADAETRRESPQTALEEQLASIWIEALGLTAVRVTDSFFDLGGNSLSAMQIVFRIREQFDLDLPILTFLNTPTIVGLARTIEQDLLQRDNRAVGDLVELVKGLTEEEAHRLLDDVDGLPHLSTTAT